MNFTPKTDEEIQRMLLIPDGEKCYAEVKESSNHISKEGKESIMLNLDIWEDVSVRCKLYVYLTPAFMLLFKHACIAMLGQEKYDSGNIQAEDFLNKSCDVIIGIQKDKKGQYPDKNIVKDFVVRSGSKPECNQQNNDGLPF